MKKHRDPTIDLLRGIAALSMLLGHSFIVYPVDISGIPWCAAIQYIIYSFHMELFFLLAGWVYSCDSYRAFLRKRSVRLLIPYFFFALSSIFLHVVGGSLINGTFSIREGLFKLLFQGGGYWFLYTLFILSAFYPLICTVFKSRIAKLLLITTILILNDVVEWPNLFTLSAVMNYLPYYIAGNLLSQWGAARIPRSRSIVPLLLTLGIVYAVPHILQSIGVLTLNNTLTFITATAFCAGLYVLCSSTSRPESDSWIHKLLKNAGRYSLQLYLFNGYLLTAIRIIICSVLKISTPIIIVCGIFIGNIVITGFLCRSILPKNKFLRLLCGL